MANNPIKDVVVDTNTIKLYNSPDDPLIRKFFLWILNHGTLAVSQKLIGEYVGIGNPNLAGLINRLTVSGRLNRISNEELKKYVDDRRYAYTANYTDRWHARLVFLSVRKLLVSGDKRLINDVNNYRKVNGVKPKATKAPQASFYQ